MAESETPGITERARPEVIGPVPEVIGPAPETTKEPP